MKKVKLSKPQPNQDQVRYITNLPDKVDHSGEYILLEDFEKLQDSRDVIKGVFEGSDNYWMLRSDIIGQIQDCMRIYHSMLKAREEVKP